MKDKSFSFFHKQASKLAKSQLTNEQTSFLSFQDFSTTAVLAQ